MTSPAIRFYSSVRNVKDLSDTQRIDLFVYFLTEDRGEPSATVKKIGDCFRDCDLAVPKSISQYLSRGLSTKPRRFVKVGTGGYKLERHRRETIAQELGGETHTVEIPTELRTLEEQLPDGPGKEWMKEALDCFGVEAYRASLIMVWIFALDHMFNYILTHKISDFNAALAAHPDQRTAKKVGQVTARDEFSILGEEMFLDLCKTAKIISPDVRRILGTALGTRNSAAHPSGVTITRAKVAMLAEDLVLNVVLKYPV